MALRLAKAKDARDSASSRTLYGASIVRGTARGTLVVVESSHVSSGHQAARDTEAEIEALDQAVANARHDLEMAVSLLEQSARQEVADIMRTHLLVLMDEGFVSRIHSQIRSDGVTALVALEHVIGDAVELLSQVANPALAERSTDLNDIRMRLTQELRAEERWMLRVRLADVTSPIIAVHELFPSFVLEAAQHEPAGLVIGSGTSLSHGAILARAYNLPVVRADSYQEIVAADGQAVHLDAIKGRLTVGGHRPAQIAQSELTQETDETPALCGSDHALPLSIWLNVADPDRPPNLTSMMAGIGLVRTEYQYVRLFDRFPSEEELFRSYQRLMESCSGRPVTIRTADIGGDKTPSHISLGPQKNPWLGLRAHRLFRFHPEILTTQVRALLRAARATETDLRLLFPMIETLQDLQFVQGLVDEAAVAVSTDGNGPLRPFSQGVLIEVPSAVFVLPELLDNVDFVSVGTNDLYQFLFAVDRDNENVQSADRPYEPAALRMMKTIVDACGKAGKTMTVCGELAAEPVYAGLLAGLGVRHVSVSPEAAGPLVSKLRDLNLVEWTEIATLCLQASSAHEVRSALGLPNDEDSPQRVSGALAIDPVCGMVVSTSDGVRKLTRDGRDYYFCSGQCLDAFSSNL